MRSEPHAEMRQTAEQIRGGVLKVKTQVQAGDGTYQLDQVAGSGGGFESLRAHSGHRSNRFVTRYPGVL